jgi:hypothetical protein
MRHGMFARVLTVLTAALLAVALAPAPAHAEPSGPSIYVAPWGDDRAGGHTWWQPVRTLQRARDIVRTLVSTMDTDITVRLFPGEYGLSEPLRLDARDSGTGGHRVVWTSLVPQLPAIVSGGTRIRGWHLVDPARNLWAATVPADLRTRQLYVEGVRAQRARGPLPVTLTATDTGYTASADTMAGWRNPSGVEFVYTGGDGYWSLHAGGLGGWTEPRCPVASISGTTVTMAQPCWDNSTKRVVRTDGSGRTYNLVGPATLGNHELPTYVENAFELLTKPGQWYLDDAAHQLYYIPRPDDPLWTLDVVAPRLETLVSGDGTQAAPVHDIAFENLQFSYATWLRPGTPEGLSEIQATYSLTGPGAFATQGLCQFINGGTCPYGNWTKTPGNVSFGYDQRIQFRDDAFVHLGAAGLDLGDGSQDATVAGSVFTDISGNGIELGGVDTPLPPTPAQHTSGNRIVDNHLYALPVEYHGGVAVDIGYAERTLVAHNQIDHTAYTGISIGWGGWPDKIAQPATPNYSNGNVLSDNLIVDHLQLLADGGGIYTQGITGTSLLDGEHVTGNVIHDQLGHGHGIYTDNGCTYESILGNVLYDTQDNWGARHADYTPPADGSTNDPTDIEHNWWMQGDPPSDTKGVTEADNHLITGPQEVPPDILAAAGLEPAYTRILDRRFALPSVPVAPEQLAATPADGTAYVSWAPSFVDNGAPVTSYTVTASPGGQRATISAQDFARTFYAVVPGLANGTVYTLTVTAHNARGDSIASLPSAAVTPGPLTGALPGAPSNVSVRVGPDDVSVRWRPPADTGGAPVLGYLVTAPGVPPVLFTGRMALWANSTRTPFTTVGGLTPGQSYTFSVAAVTAIGTGPAAAAKPVTPG